MAIQRQKKRAVVICTDKRGVFFGFTDKPFNREQMTLTECRMCVYWDASIGGEGALSATGPNEKCRITPACPERTLVDIHSEEVCTDAAVAAWRAEPWR